MKQKKEKTLNNRLEIVDGNLLFDGKIVTADYDKNYRWDIPLFTFAYAVTEATKFDVEDGMDETESLNKNILLLAENASYKHYFTPQ